MGVTLRRWPAPPRPVYNPLRRRQQEEEEEEKCAVTRHDVSPPREPRNGSAFLDGRHQFYITHGLKLAERTSKHPITEKMEGLGAQIRSVLSPQMALPSRGADARIDRPGNEQER